MIKENYNKTIVVHFGKYHGYKIEEIPSNYLKWMSETLKEGKLSIAADEEWNFREKYNCHF